MYLHNPLNIRYDSRNNWLGQLAPKNGFCTFEQDYYCVRAWLRLIRTYIRFGFSSLHDIVYRYAPAADGNNPGAYLNAVLNALSDQGYLVRADRKLDMNSPLLWFFVCGAMCKIESNTRLFASTFDIAWDLYLKETIFDDYENKDFD